MPGTCGIDPGARYMGLALVRRGRWVASTTHRGADGCSKDWAKLASTAATQASRAVDWCRQHDPERIAIETMVDQSGRKAHSHKHTTAACCQALFDALVAAGMGDLIVWQDAREVLAHGTGYGDLHYLLQQGRAGIDVPGQLGEHEASAVTHACWAERVATSVLAGLR